MAESVSDFLKREIQPIPHIIGRGILPVRGKLIIGGEPKTNKSFLAMNIAWDLARGHNIFDAAYKSGVPLMPVVQPYRVLYIEQEVGESGMRERVRGLIGDTPCEEVPFFVKTRDMNLRLDTEKGREAIQREIEQCRPDVVIGDPMAKLHVSDENSNQAMGMILRVLDRWVETYGFSVILVHHTTKPLFDNPRKGGMKLRGASAIFGDADAVCDVVRLSASHHREPVLALSFELRRDAPLEETIYVKRLKSGRVAYLGEDFHWGRPRMIDTVETREPYPNL